MAVLDKDLGTLGNQVAASCDDRKILGFDVFDERAMCCLLSGIGHVDERFKNEDANAQA